MKLEILAEGRLRFYSWKTWVFFSFFTFSFFSFHETMGKKILRTSQAFQTAVIMKSFVISKLSSFYGRSGFKRYTGPKICVSLKNLWNLLSAAEMKGHC